MPKPLLDYSIVDETREVMAFKYPLIVSGYLEDAAMYIAQLKNEHIDLKEYVRAAHSLKSSSASIGAMQLAELARQIEWAARECDTASAARLCSSEALETISDVFKRTEAELKKI